MKNWLNGVLNTVARWWNHETKEVTEPSFPSFVNKSRFLYGGHA
jgi:hypothetical protein